MREHWLKLLKNLDLHSTMCEILAPAGGRNSALAAINSGADAIYLGLSQFSARSSAENFDIEGFTEISRLARAFGVKIYVAMNTLVKDSELENFLSTLIDVWNAGADAIILSDIFLGKFIKRNYPQIKLHLSTQAGVCNAYGARLAKKYGFDRVILARETSLEDIKSIASIIETEVFVQGALCTCFSGQCYMSSFAGGNSGNRGKCKQPCRKLYSIDRVGYNETAYRLSLSDLSVGENIFKLIEAGVVSFKIEGRMRRPEYVAAAVHYYKNLLNNTVTERDFINLKRTYNRGNYTSGLAFGQDKSFISSAVQGHIGEFVGILKVVSGKYLCNSPEKFQKGDSFKILRDGKEVGGADFFENVRGGFVINSKVKLRTGDKVFITTDTAINVELLKGERKIKLSVSARFHVGERAEITVNGKQFYSENFLELAKSSPLSVSDIKNCFDKTDKYPFEISYGSIDCDEVFMPKGELNSLRRTVYEELFEELSQNANPQVVKNHTLPTLKSAKNNKIASISTQNYCKGTDILIYKPLNYEDITFEKSNVKTFLYLPPFITGLEIERIKPYIAKFDGIYCDGSWAIELAEELKMPLFLGTGLNVSNCVDVAECPSEYIALSKELTVAEQRQLSTENTFALSSGNIKVMDLIYCPFGRKCKECDKREIYTLTDESGRKFPIRRYKTNECRFEVFNCANLIGTSPVGTLIDCTLESAPNYVIQINSDERKQKEYFKNYTRGHSNAPVL